MICLAMIFDSARQARTTRRRGRKAALAELAELEEVTPQMAVWKTLLLLAIGLVGLPIGAGLLIDGARGIAREFGISEAAIGLTVVALGTSLPELATTVAAAFRRQADVVIGNVIGSNIFNITGIIGAAALARPLAVPAEILGRDYWWLVGASVLLAPFVLARRPIPRPVGGAFLAIYIVYLYTALAG